MDYINKLRSMVGKERVIMVVAGVFVVEHENRLLLQQRTDTGTWGIPGGFMELDESIQNTARREVTEETGLRLEQLELFGIYSGPAYDKTFANGDEVSLVQVLFTCTAYSGDLIRENEESLNNRFFGLNELPENIFSDHKIFLEDFLSKPGFPIVK
ncbi:hypothetical protein B0X71_09345 [Planococcus lenghuensis]|uniref:Nudix hydrolase domain-containing protein n=1 Tax=Planococcus lenghuensis TaxID=2213202 RepID=A0A1Q2KYN6_9BACL|nr:NUDIX domain-containing protein [Planococcus lenghuensis]AQQ53263.1 hypothetical protein B0X71_09345 [Planococcus lenghuensis]